LPIAKHASTAYDSSSEEWEKYILNSPFEGNRNAADSVTIVQEKEKDPLTFLPKKKDSICIFNH
jgi:hypothetical protein